MKRILILFPFLIVIYNSTYAQDLNTLNIKINGQSRSYKCNDIDYYANNWFTVLGSNKYSDNDQFTFSLPANIETGDRIVIKSVSGYDLSNTDDLMTLPSYSISYKTKNGYSIMCVPNYMCRGCAGYNIILDVKEWSGRGGYFKGNLNGVIYFNEVDKLIFSEGEFLIRIKNKEY